MSVPPPEESFEVRRDRLAAEIAQQRGQLTNAYLQLEKPLRYTEYGMKGLGFIRQNTWVFAAAPALLSIVSTAFGWKKKKTSPTQVKAVPNTPPGKTTKLARVGQAAMTGVEQGLRLYNLYRRVRSILP